MTTEIATTPAPEVQPLTVQDVQAYAPLTLDQLQAQTEDLPQLLENINQLIKERNDILGESLVTICHVHDFFSALGLDQMSGKNQASVIPFIMGKIPDAISFFKGNSQLIVFFERLKIKYGPILEERQKEIDLQKALSK